MDHIHDVNEYERIPHTQVSNVNFFLINLTYRPPHMHHDFEAFMSRHSQKNSTSVPVR